ncbi:hypothetical protein C1645_831544 [Glomus cerebriforme]|uniref:Uncharacterized protein n=1 Tax=Glomus cerebriforme TaxID=658196 RepID=A0A397SFB9_9GLOM|nr:hypothetical protein C1645_831544 [Glomus cerebriforme]
MILPNNALVITSEEYIEHLQGARSIIACGPLLNADIQRKRPAEKASSTITPPLNLRSHTHTSPPSYNEESANIADSDIEITHEDDDKNSFNAEKDHYWTLNSMRIGSNGVHYQQMRINPSFIVRKKSRKILSFNENKKLDEDTFVHQYYHKILKEIFSKDDFTLNWANEESKSSKERQILDGKNHGRKLDFCVLSKVDNINMKFLFGEIKPLSNSTFINKGIIKLAEFTKGSLDLIINSYGYVDGLETYGVLIHDKLSITIERIKSTIATMNSSQPLSSSGHLYYRKSNLSPKKICVPIVRI